MVQRTLLNKSARCWECKTPLADKTISARPKYCGPVCEQVAANRNTRKVRRRYRDQARRQTNPRPRNAASTRPRAPDPVRTPAPAQETMTESEAVNQPVETGVTRWLIERLLELPGIGGNPDLTTPETVVARVKGALNEANNRAMAWERKAKERRQK